MLVTTISEHTRFIAAVANTSDINLHSSDVVSPSPALWKVNPVASLDLIRLRLSPCCRVGQRRCPRDPSRSSVESRGSQQDDRSRTGEH